MNDTLIGHNSASSIDAPSTVTVETRVFNTLVRFAGPEWCYNNVELDEGATVGELIAMIELPLSEIFLVLCNGRDITAGLYEGGSVNCDHVLKDGDVIAFSGPVPYSYGYGAPVV